MTVPITRQIACVERELRFRRQVYARRVADQKMSQRQADDEIEAMEAVLATLRVCQTTRLHRAIPTSHDRRFAGAVSIKIPV